MFLKSLKRNVSPEPQDPQDFNFSFVFLQRRSKLMVSYQQVYNESIKTIEPKIFFSVFDQCATAVVQEWLRDDVQVKTRKFNNTTLTGHENTSTTIKYKKRPIF